MSTIFQKIIDKEIPADIVYEDEQALAFRDINPAAPTHVLVIPRKPIAKVADMEGGDKELLGHLLWVASEVARREGLEDYRRRAVGFSPACSPAGRPRAGLAAGLGLSVFILCGVFSILRVFLHISW